MDDEPNVTGPPRSTSKMSKTPSWVMLGFVLGVAFVLALPKKEPPPAPTPTPAPVKAPEPVPPAPPRTAPPLSRIEAVFEEWGRYAVWDDETTEVALWDPAEERFADYYEVRRVQGVLYFRSIPRLTRRVIRDGKHLADSPLQFTETEEQFRAWDERDRARRPFERLWRPAPPPPPPETPSPATGEVQQISPVFEAPKPGADGAGK
jgi:hypothetical protein